MTKQGRRLRLRPCLNNGHMRINDIHHHIVTRPVGGIATHNQHTLQQLRDERRNVEGDTVVFIHPFLKDLYACSEHHYRIRSREGFCHELIFECEQCGKISYVGSDPYRQDNMNLCIQSQGYSDIHPYLFLALCNNTINEELSFFEKNYKGLFHGIKVHPNLSAKRISEIEFNSKYPLIIHAGMMPEDDPKDIIKFARKYQGNVLIAHMARCKISVLNKIKSMPNVFIDTSPSYLPSQIVNKVSSRYYDSDYFHARSETEVFEKLIEIVGAEKIIYGSDAPFGSLEESLSLYQHLELPEETKKSIFEYNFHQFNRVI